MADTRFKVGQINNPHGRPPLSADEKRIRALSKRELNEIYNSLLNGKLTVKDLRDLVKKENSNPVRALVASVIVKAIDSGDAESLEKLLNRMIGKVKDEIHHSGEITNPPQIRIYLPEGRDSLVAVQQNITTRALPKSSDSFSSSLTPEEIEQQNITAQALSEGKDNNDDEFGEDPFS